MNCGLPTQKNKFLKKKSGRGDVKKRSNALKTNLKLIPPEKSFKIIVY